MRALLYAIVAVTAGFHLWSAGVSPFTALVQRPVHLAAMAALAVLLHPFGRPPLLGVGRPQDSRWRVPDWLGRLLDAATVGAVILPAAWLVRENAALVARAGSPLRFDLILGAVAIVGVLELARRTTGWGIVAVAVAALGYAVLGPYLPGILAHRGYGARRIVEHLFLSTEGIWGIPLGVSADFVFLFVLFGALLDAAGGGKLLIGLADRVAGQTRGGPAKTAVVGSALMGSLSGSAVANVVTTGSVTIPVMRKTGFSARDAAAIEAAASTGGQLVPPVMGAGAFILATWTSIPYVRVAAAAAIPALLYYVALFAAIHFRAHQRGIAPRKMSSGSRVRDGIHLLIPLGVIVLLLGFGRSPMRAAFWGVVSAVLVSSFRTGTRLRGHRVRAVLETAARGSVQVAAACAAAGVVVGVASLTGIGLRMSELIVTLSGGVLPIALALTAIGAVILGMGLPTTAAYVVLAALGAPALVELGVRPLAAHLFIFYFGCLSNVTPPVSLAAFAAAGISGAPAMRTAVTASGLAGVGFLIPFAFVYGPELLLSGSLTEIGLATVTAIPGAIALAAASVGWFFRDLSALARGAMALGAGGLLFPSLATGVVGLGLVTMVWVNASHRSKRGHPSRSG